MYIERSEIDVMGICDVDNDISYCNRPNKNLSTSSFSTDCPKCVKSFDFLCIDHILLRDRTYDH